MEQMTDTSVKKKKKKKINGLDEHTVPEMKGTVGSQATTGKSIPSWRLF